MIVQVEQPGFTAAVARLRLSEESRLAGALGRLKTVGNYAAGMLSTMRGMGFTHKRIQRSLESAVSTVTTQVKRLETNISRIASDLDPVKALDRFARETQEEAEKIAAKVKETFEELTGAAGLSFQEIAGQVGLADRVILAEQTVAPWITKVDLQIQEREAPTGLGLLVAAGLAIGTGLAAESGARKSQRKFTQLENELDKLEADLEKQTQRMVKALAAAGDSDALEVIEGKKPLVRPATVAIAAAAGGAGLLALTFLAGFGNPRRMRRRLGAFNPTAFLARTNNLGLDELIRLQEIISEVGTKTNRLEALLGITTPDIMAQVLENGRRAEAAAAVRRDLERFEPSVRVPMAPTQEGLVPITTLTPAGSLVQFAQRQLAARAAAAAPVERAPSQIPVSTAKPIVEPVDVFNEPAPPAPTAPSLTAEQIKRVASAFRRIRFGGFKGMGRLGQFTIESAPQLEAFIRSRKSAAIAQLTDLRRLASQATQRAQAIGDEGAIRWNSDVTDWTILSENLMTTEEGIPGDALAFVNEMTGKIFAHADRVATKQASRLRAIGREDRAAETIAVRDQMRQAFRELARQKVENGSLGGLGGLGAVISTTVIVLASIAILMTGVVVGVSILLWIVVNAGLLGEGDISFFDEPKEVIELLIKLLLVGAGVFAAVKILPVILPKRGTS